MQQLTGTIRAYPWGSTTMIPQLRGQSASSRPVAELWYGAHPASPSTLPDGTALDAAIAADPDAALGRRVREKYGDRLPFLLKLLAAGAPLSLQAHPSLKQAQEGFARENAAGIALTAPERNYKDDNHKPELLVALTRFQAMAGFRPMERTLELFDVLSCPEIDHYRSMVEENSSPEAEGRNLRALFTTWITIPVSARTQLIDAVVRHCRVLTSRADWMSDVARTILDLADRYPGDVGVLGALLLNHVTLEPGEAIYLSAGQLHAYVHGMGVEIMANSDNVLRGGLTSKYVDVAELVHVLRFESLSNPVVQADHGFYPVPIDEFVLSRHELGQEGMDLAHDGPAILMCTRGTARIAEMEIPAGEAVWIPAVDDGKQLAASAGDAGPTEVFWARC